jgi:hypothetical protein
MKDSTKNIELLDRFMANEKKSKWWTTINIGIFCLLGLSIFFLAYKLKKSNAELDKALAQLDKSNVSLQQDSISLTKTVTKTEGNYDSLKRVLDTVLMVLKNKNLPVSSNIKNVISYERPTHHVDPGYTVFMQCMPGFERLMPSLVKDLKAKKYKVPKWEIVEKIAFDPAIKYFYEDDADEAKKIAALINSSDDYFRKNPVKVQKLNLKSPKRQIEVWVGEYQRKDVQQLIQQSAADTKKK